MAERETSQTTSCPTQRQQSWKQMIIQVVIFQLIMRFLLPRPAQQIKNPVTGQIIPPLKNAYSRNTKYDVLVYITSNYSATLTDLLDSQPIWFIPSQIYDKGSFFTSEKDITANFQYRIPGDLFRETSDNSLNSINYTDKNDEKLSEKNDQEILGNLSYKSEKSLSRVRKNWNNLYLTVFILPHFIYGNEHSSVELNEILETLKEIDLESSEEASLISQGTNSLIEYMEPVNQNTPLKNLLHNDQQNGTINLTKGKGQTDFTREKPHWKNHMDIRMVVDYSSLGLQSLKSVQLGKYIKTIPDKGVYLPIVHPSDVWLLDKNYIELNNTFMDHVVNLSLTFRSVNNFKWTIEAQLFELWKFDKSDVPMNILSSLQSHTKKEIFMIKRMLLDTNPYLLAFSAVFMLLHALFSVLAFKNDIQFWHKNESMIGLSALSMIAGFISELIIALYLYDSEETSALVLFEILIGLVISGWKVTKALNVSLSWKRGIPFISLAEKATYKESLTKKYDEKAIKFMSICLAPCILGYASYSLKYKQHKSWYSYIISTLAGTVYSFGFILMTPQLYINYKLKSVDHLPWRAFTYKALNTFVDDIAAFIIDMPLLHRLACFRDDIIFVLYLYQRWIYSVDKSRPSFWEDDSVQKPYVDDGKILKKDLKKILRKLCQPPPQQLPRHRMSMTRNVSE